MLKARLVVISAAVAAGNDATFVASNPKTAMLFTVSLPCVLSSILCVIGVGHSVNIHLLLLNIIKAAQKLFSDLFQKHLT